MSRWTNPTYSLTLDVTGVKFYGGDVNVVTAEASLSAECNVSVSADERLLGRIDISANSNVTVSGTEILYATSSIDAGTIVVTVGLEIAEAVISASGDVSVSTTAYKFGYANSQVSGEGTTSGTSYKLAYSNATPSAELIITPTAYKFAYSESEIAAESSATTTALEILYASVQTSGLAITVTVGKEILYINPQPTGAATVLSVSAVRFSDNIVEDTEQIRPLLILDGKPLTEHNRQSSISVVHSYAENRNWKASRSRYYKTESPRKTFSISWSNLPSDRTQTVDLKFGRDKIRELASDPDIHVLKFLNMDSDGTTPYTETVYNVVVRSYNESLIRRDVDTDLYLWDCSLELEEV
jgi:hypothetical protein